MSEAPEKIWKSILNAIMFFVPHFITEEVAVIRKPEGGFDPVCSLDALEEDDYYDDVVKLKAITWLGMGFSYQEIE